jgi:hypothetical protein
VLLGMDRAVDFDDEPQLRAVELNDVAHDDVLTPEPPTAELTPSKGAPQDRLGLRRAAP